MVSVIPALVNVTAIQRLGHSLIVLPVRLEEVVNVLAIAQEMDCVSMVSVIALVAGETDASTQRSIEANAHRYKLLIARPVWKRLELGVSGVVGALPWAPEGVSGIGMNVLPPMIVSL